MNTKLYIGNLSYQTGEDALKEAFSTVGTVRSVALISDRVTGQSRGFGFVEFDSSEDAQRAIDELDGRDLDGRALSVSIARERTERPRFGGGGGGGYPEGGGGGRGGDSGGGSGRSKRGSGGGARRW